MYVALAVFSIMTFAFSYYFVIETAGKQIDQILREILGSGYQEAEKSKLRNEGSISG